MVAYKYYELLCGKLAESSSIVSGQLILGISAANPKSFVVRASSIYQLRGDLNYEIDGNRY